MSDEESTRDSETKQYRGYLVVNWRDDEVRFRKTEPTSRRSSPYELAIPVNVAVRVPDVPVPEISAEIEVPPAQVIEAVTHERDVDEEAEQ
jgi:hypothetical protein